MKDSNKPFTFSSKPLYLQQKIETDPIFDALNTFITHINERMSEIENPISQITPPRSLNSYNSTGHHYSSPPVQQAKTEDKYDNVINEKIDVGLFSLVPKAKKKA